MDQFSHNLSSASPTEAKSALRALLTAFPIAGHEDMNGVIATYLMAVDGYCLVAIQKAVMRFIRGEVEGHDGRFIPTPAQLSREVRYRQGLMTPPAKPKALPAPGDIIPDEGSKARVAAMARDYSGKSGPTPYDEHDTWAKARPVIPTPKTDDRAA